MKTDMFYGYGFVDREDDFCPALIDELIFVDEIVDR